MSSSHHNTTLLRCSPKNILYPEYEPKHMFLKLASPESDGSSVWCPSAIQLPPKPSLSPSPPLKLYRRRLYWIHISYLIHQFCGLKRQTSCTADSTWHILYVINVFVYNGQFIYAVVWAVRILVCLIHRSLYIWSSCFLSLVCWMSGYFCHYWCVIQILKLVTSMDAVILWAVLLSRKTH